MARALAPLAVCALATAGLACGGGGAATQEAPVGPPASMSILSGNGQTGVVGTTLGQQVVVEVADAQGRPVAGQIVNFRIVEGGGSVFAGVGQTNADGTVRDWWTLGPAPGLQRLEARAVDPLTGARLVFAVFEATATVPTLELVSGGGQLAAAGGVLPAPITVRLVGAPGQPVQGVQVHFQALDGGTAVPADATTDADGLASTAWTLGPAGLLQRLEVSSTGVAALQVNGKACSAGELACSGRCIDPSSDRAFCGAADACSAGTAGVVCGAGQACQDGQCVAYCAPYYPVARHQVTANQPRGFVVADVDRDGVPDVVTTLLYGGAINVFRGRPDGTLAAPDQYAVAGALLEVTAGDLSGDGWPDLVVSHGGFSVLLNQGDGTFGLPVDYPGGDYGQVIVDFDRDGALDVVVAEMAGRSLILYRNTGGGNLARQASLATPGLAYQVVSGDLDHDGVHELIVGTSAGVSIHRGAVEGGYVEPPVSFAAEEAYYHFADVGDFDGDGWLDVIVGTVDGFTILRNPGDGTLDLSAQPHPVETPQPSPNFVFTGDLDGDGALDVLLGGEANVVVLLENDGLGGFGAPLVLTLPASTVNVWVHPADLNGDGLQDLVLGQYGAGQIGVMLATGLTCP